MIVGQKTIFGITRSPKTFDFNPPTESYPQLHQKYSLDKSLLEHV